MSALDTHAVSPDNAPMKIMQLSVFLENQPGKLTVPCRALAEAGINIMAVSLAHTHRVGVLRLIVSDGPRGRDVLDAAGCVVETGHVVAIAIGNHPGGLEEVLEVIEAEQINLEDIYPLTRPADQAAVLICTFADPDAALAALTAAHITVITDLNAL